MMRIHDPIVNLNHMKNLLQISQDANPNYLARIIKAENLHPHSNADKLQLLTVCFQNVIVGMDVKEGDLLVYFPVESKINADFLSHTNQFRHSELNEDKGAVGFFDDNGRVRAVKLRGEKSFGYCVELKTVEDFVGYDLSEYVGQDFDTIGDVKMCEKYFIPVKVSTPRFQGKKARVSRIIDKYFSFHVDTENLRRNAEKINPEDDISITYKIHGSSFIVSNIPVKRKLNIVEKILKFIRVPIVDSEYDFVFASRKVVKNGDMLEGKEACHFYKEDIWKIAKDELQNMVPKGYTFYGEFAGYTSSGSAIQGQYDYGCEIGQHKLYVYRITYTNDDGLVTNLSTDQMRKWSEHYGFTYVPHFYTGKAKHLFPELDTENHWHEEFVKKLEETYNDKKCFLCKNDVYEEGIVLRKENPFIFEAYKLKSPNFLLWETEQLDKGVVDTESAN